MLSLSPVAPLAQRLQALLTALHEDFPSSDASEAIVLSAGPNQPRIIHPDADAVGRNRFDDLMRLDRLPSGIIARAVWATTSEDCDPPVMLVIWTDAAASYEYREAALGRLQRAVSELEVWISAHASRLRWASARALGASAARSTERRRLAYAMHSSVAQELSVARMYREILTMSDPSDTGEVVEAISQHVEKAYEYMRSILDELHSSSDPRPLADALSALVDEYERSANLTTTMRFSLELGDLDCPVSERTGAAILYIAREALQNVHEHSRATAVTIRASTSDHTFTLEIEDDGVGLEGATSDPAREHLGLAGMREQARASDADLRIEERQGGGTIVVLRAPCGPR